MRLWLSLLLGLCVAGQTALGQSSVVVRLDPPTIDVQPGEAFSLDLLVDLGPLKAIGWGLDLSYDSLTVAQVGPPAIGPLWMPGFSSDGDGLTGYSAAGSTGGGGVLLARLSYQALSPGSTQVVPSYTVADLNEGFPLDPIGYAEVLFQSATINVLPEPTPAFLLAMAASIAVLHRRHGIRQRR